MVKYNNFYISAGECKIQNIRIANSSIKLNTNKDRLDLYSGDTFEAGAFINLYSKNTSYAFPGAFRIAAMDNEGNPVRLFGDGINKELWWDNTRLSDIAVVNKLITENGYISFACGLTLQWIHSIPNGGFVTVTDIKNTIASFTLPLSETFCNITAFYGPTGDNTITIHSLQLINNSTISLRYRCDTTNILINSATTIFAICF